MRVADDTRVHGDAPEPVRRGVRIRAFDGDVGLLSATS
jgi:hypothetical protein